MSAFFPWTFCFMPNALAGGRPHLGHLWAIAHFRYYYWQVQMWDAEASERRIDLKWNIVFESGADPETKAKFAAIMDWCGWRPDTVDDISPYLDLSCAVSRIPWLRTFLRLFRANRDELTDMAYPTVVYRLLYFLANNVYWHGRGQDLLDLNMGQQSFYPVEKAASTYLNIPSPIMFWHPVLVDEGGKKLDAHLSSEEYTVTPDLLEMDADAVFAGLCKAIGGKTPYDLEPLSSFRNGANIVRHVAQFFYASISPFGHRLLGEPVVVPRDWRKHIRPEVVA